MYINAGPNIFQNVKYSYSRANRTQLVNVTEALNVHGEFTGNVGPPDINLN